MKKTSTSLIRLLTFLLLTTLSYGVQAQLSMANYAFTHATNGSLEDISSGPTVLLSGVQDDVATAVAPLGFDFYFMGNKYTHISANTNGCARLHTSSTATAIGTGSVSSFTANTATFAVMSADNECGDGIRYKVIGTAPNRKFVLEWKNFYIHYTDITNAGNMQLWLSETTGRIDYVYGELYNTSTSAKTNNIFVSSGNTAGASAVVTVGAPATVNTTATTSTSNSIAAGTVTAGIGSPLVANLGSSAQGSRVVYSFVPPTTSPAAPTSLTFTNVGALGMTLNWVDNATTEGAYIVTRATDAGFTTGVTTTTLAANATSTVVTGLTQSTTYYFKVTAVSEAAVSADLTGSQATNAPSTFISAATGNWTAGATWVGGMVPSSVDNVLISTGHTVTIDATSTIKDVAVEGTLDYGTSATALTVTGNVTINSGGTFTVAFGTTGKSLNVAGNITNNGTLNLSNTSALLNLNGTANTQTLDGSGTLTSGIITGLTINNTNPNPMITWGWAGVSVSGTLTLTSGLVNLGANELTLGTATTTLGTLTYNSTPRGGFIVSTGGKFSRWIATAFAGSVANTTYTGLFPMVTPIIGDLRLLYLAKTGGTITTGGKLSVSFDNATGTTSITPYTDGANSIDRRTNASWTLASGGADLGTAVFTIKLRAFNFGDVTDYTKLAVALSSSAPTGTHGASTVTSNIAEVNRTAVTAAGILNTFYIGSTSANTLVTPVISVASGDWSNTATWNTGAVPTAADNVLIVNGHNVTVTTAGSFAKNVSVNVGGTLTQTAGDLTIGTTNNNNSFAINGGTYDMQGGTLTVNGSFSLSANTAGVFKQSAGSIIVDGNSGTLATSASSHIVDMYCHTTSTLQLTGGSLTVVDPPLSTTTTVCAFKVFPSVAHSAGTGWTLNLGDGVSTTAGGHSGGFLVNLVNTNTFAIQNVVVNTGQTINRYVTTSNNIAFNNVTVNSGSEYRISSGTYVKGNITNNGLITATSTLNLSDFSGTTAAVGTAAQTISGTGTFRNSIPVATISAGGSGYVVGDLVTLSGGTSTTAAQFRVTAVTSGAISGLYCINAPSYSVAPTYPASLTGGTGTGATISALTNMLNSAVANLTSLIVNNNNATGITLSTPLSISGTLTLTSGLINTSATNTLQLGTATAAGTLSGTPSATNMIVGPFQRTFAASRTASGTYTNATLLPVGKGGAYAPIYLDPSTNASGALILSAELVTPNTGFGGGGVSNLSTKAWSTAAVVGSGNMTNVFVRVSDAGVTGTSKLLHSGAIDGEYNGTPGGSAAASTNITTNAAIAVGEYLGNFAYGDLTPCSPPSESASLFTEALKTSTTFTGGFTPAASSPTGYLVVRLASGATPIVPTDGTVYTASSSALGGTIVTNLYSAPFTFTQTGLTASTTYDYYVYSFNNTGCAGPVYYSEPLLYSLTTCSATTGTPGTPTSSGINAIGFTASWTASSTVGAEYEIDVATNTGFTTFVPGYNARNVGALLTVSISDLTPSTTYYVRVRAVTSGCYSVNTSTLTVTTDCNAENAPTTTQTFSTYVPSCWSEAVGTLAATTTFTSNSSAWATEVGMANTGTNPAVRINLYSIKNDWIISQPINLGTGNTYRLKYDMAVTSYLGTAAQSTLGTHKVDVVISTDGGSTWSNTNILRTYTGVGTYSSTGQTEEISLAAYSGTIKIGFVATTTSTSPDIDFHIDNFLIEQIASVDMGVTALASPAAPGCNNATQGVTVTVKNFGSTAIDFATNPTTVTCNVTGGATATLTATLNTGTLAAGATQDVVLTGTIDMSAAATYNFAYSTSVTGDGNGANNNGTATRTITAVTSVPYTQNFDAGSLPTDWTQTGWIFSSSAHSASGGGVYVNLDNVGEVATLTSPKFGALASGQKLFFDYRLVNFSGYPSTALSNATNWGNVKVQISTDCGNTFSDLATINNTNHVSTTSWATKEYDLSSYAGQNGIFRVIGTYLAGDYYLDIDNFAISAPCTGTPTAGTVNTSIGAVCPNGAVTLSVTGASTSPGVTYQWQASTNSGSTWANIAGATSTSAIVNPAITTVYRLVATCTNGGASANSTEETVTVTLPAYATLPYANDFETWSTSSCVTGNIANDIPGVNFNTYPVSGNNSWRRDDASTTESGWGNTLYGYTPTAHTGTNSARLHTATFSTSKGFLDLYVNLSGSENKNLSFYYINAGGSDSLRVLLSTDAGVTFTQVGAKLTTATTWTIQNFTLIGGTATSVVRIEGGGASDFASDMGIDNLNISVISTPPPCTALTSPANAATAVVTTPTLTWASASGATGYKIKIGTTAGGADVLAETNVGNVTSYATATLNYLTTYHVTVSPYNNVGDATGCTSTSFTTMPNPNYGGGPDGNDANNPNSGGYYFANSLAQVSYPYPSQPAYSWIDPVAGGHTEVNLAALTGGTEDDGFFTIPNLGFDFTYYGNTYRTSNVHISTNGVLLFGTAPTNNGDYGDNAIPSTSGIKNFIAGCWADLESEGTSFVGGNGKIYYSTSPTQSVITWWHAHDYGDAAEYITFQIVLTPNGTVKIQYNDTESTADEKLAPYTTSDLLGDAQVGIANSDGTKGVRYRNNGSGAALFGSPLAVAFATSQTQLPIELKSLTAAAQAEVNIVKWVTSSEKNVSEFIVERSANGRTGWATVATVKAVGNSQVENAYTATDATPLSMSYYRLRSVDNDGTEDISNVVSVARRVGRLNITKVYPVPTSDNLNVQFEAKADETVSIEVTNVLGQVVMQRSFAAKAGFNALEIDMTVLKTGSYILTLNNGKEAVTQRIIKQ